MLFDIQPGYYSYQSVPIRTGSKQSYIAQPLEFRRHRIAMPEGDFVRTSKSIVRRTFFGYETSFSDEETRKSFVFKMFFLLSAQLAFMLIVIFIFTTEEHVKEKAKENHLFWHIAGLVGLGAYLILAIIKPARTTRILNSILVTILVIAIAIVFGAITVVYDLQVIVYTLAIETSVTIFITILAKFAPCDVAGCAMIFCVTATGLCVFSVVASLVWLLTRFAVLHLILSGISVVLISLYLLFNAQLMMDGTFRTIPPREYVIGNVHLYVDLLLMFFYLLRLLVLTLVRRCRKKRRGEGEAAA